MATLRLIGLAPEERNEEVLARKRVPLDDRDEWDPKNLLNYERTMESLVEGRYYGRGYTHKTEWDTAQGHTIRPTNKASVHIPQKTGKQAKIQFQLGFLPYRGEHVHSWIRVGRDGIFVVTRRDEDTREPPPAPEEFTAIPTSYRDTAKKLVGMVCQHLGQDAAIALPIRLQQLTEATLVAPWALRLETKDIYLSSKLMSELGVECHRQGPYDGAQRFLWHFNLSDKTLRVARLEEPAGWATLVAPTPIAILRSLPTHHLHPLSPLSLLQQKESSS